MSFLEGLGLELGIGIAIGMLAGTTGTSGSARGRMTLLSALIGLVVGYVLAGTADLGGLSGALICLVGAVVGCLVVSDVISGAGRREGGGGGVLGFLVSLAALFVAAVTIAFKPFALLAAAALIWLGISRRRRARRKHEGLRVLR